jgi:hypothetical protein
MELPEHVAVQMAEWAAKEKRVMEEPMGAAAEKLKAAGLTTTTITSKLSFSSLRYRSGLGRGIEISFVAQDARTVCVAVLISPSPLCNPFIRILSQ